MKHFIVETSDDGTDEKLRGLLYLGNESERADAVGYMLNIVNVTEIQEEHRFANGERRMTTAQREALWRLCGGYNVPFNETDYRIQSDKNVFGSPAGYVEGWVGGYAHSDGSVKPTIYVGVAPDGRVNS